MYRISAGLDRCGFVGVDLRPDLAFDLPALLEAMQRHRPALVFLSYPNNPTGLLASRADISAILAAAPGLVVVDEAYLPFAQSTWIGELPHHPRLLVLRTLSKLGLAGLRLGMLFGAPAVLAEVDKLRPPFNVNSLTQAAVSYLLDHTPVLDAQAAQVRADRAELARELARLPGVTALPSTANFLLVRVPGAPRVWAGLHQRGILVKDVSGSHPLLADCLRITVGTPEENRRLLGALQACL
jgi:histidinol-phosphate aminotransferase